MSEHELQEIIRKLKNGDASPLKQFFVAHSAYCVNYVQASTSCSREDAKDVFMTALLILRENLLRGKIKQLENPRFYLAATSVNQWKKRYQNQKKEQNKQDEVIWHYYQQRHSLSEEYDPLVQQEEAESNQTEKKEKIRNILTALKSLDKKCQKILKLFYTSKASMKEIAEKVGLANANVAKVTKRRCYLKWLNAIEKLKK